MLVVEMQRNFLLKVKSLDRTDLKDMASYDILFLLNQAQDIIIDKLIAEKKFEALRPITVSAAVLNAAFIGTGTYDPGVNGAKVVDLSALGTNTFRNYVRSQSKTTRSAVPAGTDVIMANVEIDKNEVYKFETNGTNKPIFTNPKEWREGKYLVVLPDGYVTSFTSITVVYVRFPAPLILTTPATDTCELPVFLHQEIVDMAIQISNETVNVNDARKK